MIKEELSNYIVELESELLFLQDDYLLDDKESNYIDFLEVLLVDLKRILACG